MIRFSAFLVVVAVGLLVAGVVTSKLLLVYAAIGVSGVALLALGIGAAVKWRELFGKPQTAASDVSTLEPVAAQAAAFQAPQAQPGLTAYSRPSAAGPVWEPADPLWEPAAARPANSQPAATNATGRDRPAVPVTGSVPSGRATEAALWESAAPPTGTFPGAQPAAPQSQPDIPRPQPAAQAPGTRSAEPPAAGSPRSSEPVVPPVSRPAAFQRPSPAFTPRSGTAFPSPAPPSPAPPSPAPPAAPAAKNLPAGPAPAPAQPRGPAQASQTAAVQAPQPPAQQPAAATPESSAPKPAAAPPSADPQPAARLADAASPAAGSVPAAEDAQANATLVTTPKPPGPEPVGDSPAAPPSPATPPDVPPASAVEAGPPAAAPAPGREPGPDPKTVVTVVPGVPRYHNASCLLIRFMGEDDLDKMTLAAAREAGCTPCRACLPDQPDRAQE